MSADGTDAGSSRPWWQKALPGLAIAVAMLALFAFFCDYPRFVDEWGHGEQILRFTRGDWQLVDNMTTTPGYHALMALPVKALGATSLPAMRLLSLLGGLAGVFFFYRIVAQLWPQERWRRTVQLAALPVCFPYWFLLYTDLWSLTFVLLAVWLALREKIGASAVAMAVAVTIRQPAIFWALLVGLAVASRNGWNARGTVARGWPYLLVGAGFVGFVVWNGGIAVHGRELQQPTFNLTNVWFFLFLVAVLFLPQGVASVGELWTRCRTDRQWRWGTIVAAGGLWLAFGWTFGLIHIFNRINLDYLLHNMALYAAATQPAARVVALFAVLLGAVSWLLTPLRPEEFSGLRWLGLLSVVVLPYVDPRYYIIPFALFLALRPAAPRWVEVTQTVFYVALALWIDVASFRMWWFP